MTKNIIISLQHQPQQRPLRPRPRPWTSLPQLLQPLPQQQHVWMRHHSWCCIHGISMVQDHELFSRAWVPCQGFSMELRPNSQNYTELNNTTILYDTWAAFNL